MARIPQSVGGSTPEMRAQLARQAEARAAQAQAERAQVQGDSLGPLGFSGAAQAVPPGVQGQPQGAVPPQQENLQADSSAGFSEAGVPLNSVPEIPGAPNPYQQAPNFQQEVNQFNPQDFGGEGRDTIQDPKEIEDLVKQQYYSGQASQWEKPTLGIDYKSYDGVQKLLNYGTRNADLETIADAGNALALGLSETSASATSGSDINATQSLTTGRNSLFNEVSRRSNGIVNETALTSASLNAVTKVLFESLGSKSQESATDVEQEVFGDVEDPFSEDSFDAFSMDSLDLNNKADAILPGEGMPIEDARRRVGSSSKNYLAQEARINGAGNDVISPIKSLDSDLLGTALDAAIANGLANVSTDANGKKVVMPSFEGRRLINAQIQNAANVSGGPLSARVIIPPKKPGKGTTRDATRLPYTLESERSGIKTRRATADDFAILKDELVQNAAYNLSRTKHTSTPAQLGTLAVAFNIATNDSIDISQDPELQKAQTVFKNLVGIGTDKEAKIQSKRAAASKEPANAETVHKIQMQEANKLVRSLSSWNEITSSGAPEYSRVSVDPIFGRMFDMNPRTNPADPVNRFLNNYQEPVFLQVPAKAGTYLYQLGDKVQKYHDDRAKSGKKGLDLNAPTDIMLGNIAFTIAPFISSADRNQSISDQIAEVTPGVLLAAAEKGDKIITLLQKIGVYKDGAAGGVDPEAINSLLPATDSSKNNLRRDEKGTYLLDHSQGQGLDFSDPEIREGVLTIHDLLKTEKLKDAHPKLLAYITAAELVANQDSKKPWRPKAIAGADGNSAGPVFSSVSSGRSGLARNSGLLISEAAGISTNTRAYVAQIMSDKLGNDATQRRIFKNNSGGIGDYEALSQALQESIASAPEKVLKDALKGPTTVDAYDFPDFLHQGTIKSSPELQQIIVDVAKPFYKRLDGTVDTEGLYNDAAELLAVTLQHSKEQFVAREVKAGQQVAMQFDEYLTPSGPRGVPIPLGSAGLREINNGKSTTVTLPNNEKVLVTDKEVAKGVLNQKKSKDVTRWDDAKGEFVSQIHEYARGSNDVNQSVVINGQRLEAEALYQLSEGVNDSDKHVNSWSQVFDYFEGTAMGFPAMFHEMNRANGAVDRALKWNPVEASQNAVEALPNKILAKLGKIAKSDHPFVDIGRNGDYAYVMVRADEAYRMLGELDVDNPDDKYAIAKNRGLINVYKTLGWKSIDERGDKPGDMPNSLEVDVRKWLAPVEYTKYLKGRPIRKKKKALEALLDLNGLFGERSDAVKQSIGRARRLADEARAKNKRFYT